MQKVMKVLLSSLLVFTALFSYTPSIIQAEEETPVVEVLEEDEDLSEEQEDETLLEEQEGPAVLNEEEDPVSEEEFPLTEGSLSEETELPETEESDELQIKALPKEDELQEDGSEETNPYNIKVEERVTGDRGLFITGDEDFLNVLSSVTYSRYNSDTGEWEEHESGQVTFYRGADSFAYFQNHQYGILQLIKEDDGVLIPEDVLKGEHIENSSFDETSKISFYVPGFDTVEVSFTSLTLGCKDGKVDFSISQDDASGDILITSFDEEWLSALTKTVTQENYRMVKYGSSLSMGGYFLNCTFGNLIQNDKERKDIVYDEQTKTARILYDAVLRQKVPKNVTIDSLSFNVYGYGKYDLYDTEEIGLTITNGVIPVPENVTLSQIYNGNLIIKSEDKAFMKALTDMYTPGMAASFVVLDRKKVWPHTYPFSNDTGLREIFYDDATGEAYVKGNDIKRSGVINGKYNVLVSVKGYEVKSYSLDIGFALNEPPADVTVDAKEDQITFSTSEDTNWIFAMKEYSLPDGTMEIGSYIHLWNTEEGKPTISYWFGNNDGVRQNEDLTFSEDGTSVMIDKDAIYRRRLPSGTYSALIHARGYGDVRIDDIEVSTSIIEDLPEISVELLDKGLVISSKDTEWLDHLCNEAPIERSAFIRLRRTDRIDDRDNDYSFYPGDEHLVKEGNTIYLPSAYLESYIIADNYYVAVGSYGYKTYVTQTPIYISGVKDIPYDTRFVQDSEGSLTIYSKDTDFLNALGKKWTYDDQGDVLDAGSRVGFYSLGENDQNGEVLGNKVATGSSASGTLIKEYKNTDKETQIYTQMDEHVQGATIDRQLLRKAGIKTGTYELSLGLPGYISGNARVEILLLENVEKMTVGETVKLDFGEDYVEWESSDSSIATVEDGVVTALKEGTVRITAYSQGIMDEIDITVEEKDFEGIRIKVVDDEIVITSNDTAWLKALAAYGEEHYYEPEKNKDGGVIRFFSVNDEDEADGRYNTSIGNAFHYESGFETAYTYYGLNEDETKLIIPKTTISIYELLTGRYGIELKALGYDPIVIYKDIVSFVLDETIDASVSYDENKGLLLTSDNKKWLDGLTEAEGDSVYDSYIYLYNNATGNGKFNGRFNKHFNELVRLDERTVLIETGKIVDGRGFETDDYTVKIKSYGYTTYIHPETVHITGVKDAPENVDAFMNETGDLIVSSTDETYLKNIINGGSIHLMEDGKTAWEYGISWFDFSNTDGASKLSYDEANHRVVVSNQVLKSAGVRNKTYDVSIHAKTYRSKMIEDISITLDVAEYTITFNANGGTGKMAKQTAYSGVDTPLAENLFTRKTYEFVGWSTKRSGEVEYENGGLINKVFEKAKQNITLYALWRPIKVNDINITGPLYAAAGKTITLKAEVLPADANNKKLTWTSSDKTIATVSNGKVTAKKGMEGKSVIISAEAKDGSGIREDYEVFILSPVTKVHILYDGKDVTSSTIGVEMGEETRLSLDSINDPNNASQEVTWTSSKPKLATVDEKGNVTVTGTKGTVKITAKASDGSAKSASVTINVAHLVTDIKVYNVNDKMDEQGNYIYNEANAHITKGKTLKLKTVVSPADASSKTVVWTSSDTSAASVSAGTVTGKKVDELKEVIITATAKDGSFVYDSYKLYVHPLTSSVTLKDEHGTAVEAGGKILLNQTEGRTYQLSASSLPEDSLQTYKWTTSSKAIATVDGNGLVTFTGKKGTVKITAAASDGSGKKAIVSFIHDENENPEP